MRTQIYFNMAKRRKAINCRLTEKSRYSKNYYKYVVTIEEKDGTRTDQPAYGKDMQDALSRLINTERTIKVEKRMERHPFFFFVAWLFIMAIPIMFHHDLTYTPWFILYMFGAFTSIFIFAGLWQSYLEKGK